MPFEVDSLLQPQQHGHHRRSRHRHVNARTALSMSQLRPTAEVGSRRGGHRRIFLQTISTKRGRRSARASDDIAVDQLAARKRKARSRDEIAVFGKEVEWGTRSHRHDRAGREAQPQKLRSSSRRIHVACETSFPASSAIMATNIGLVGWNHQVRLVLFYIFERRRQ